MNPQPDLVVGFSLLATETRQGTRKVLRGKLLMPLVGFMMARLGFKE